MMGFGYNNGFYYPPSTVAAPAPQRQGYSYMPTVPVSWAAPQNRSVPMYAAPTIPTPRPTWQAPRTQNPWMAYNNRPQSVMTRPTYALPSAAPFNYRQYETTARTATNPWNVAHPIQDVQGQQQVQQHGQQGARQPQPISLPEQPPPKPVPQAKEPAPQPLLSTDLLGYDAGPELYAPKEVEPRRTSGEALLDSLLSADPVATNLSPVVPQEPILPEAPVDELPIEASTTDPFVTEDTPKAMGSNLGSKLGTNAGKTDGSVILEPEDPFTPPEGDEALPLIDSALEPSPESTTLSVEETLVAGAAGAAGTAITAENIDKGVKQTPAEDLTLPTDITATDVAKTSPTTLDPTIESLPTPERLGAKARLAAETAIVELLEQDPTLEANLKAMQVEMYLDDPNLAFFKVRDTIHQSRIIPFALRFIKGRIVSEVGKSPEFGEFKEETDALLSHLLKSPKDKAPLPVFENFTPITPDPTWDYGELLARKVGAMIEHLLVQGLQDNPKTLAKVEQSGVEAYLDHPEQLFIALRDVVKQNPVISGALNQFQNQLVNEAPPNTKPLVEKALNWLNHSPTTPTVAPETLDIASTAPIPTTLDAVA